jgi:PAS domain S-box-containing protein
LEKRVADLRAAQVALKQAEGNQQISEEKFQTVFRSSPITFSLTTLKEGRFVDVNVAFEKRYGYRRAELIGHTVLEVGMWVDPVNRDQLVTQLQRGETVRNVITRRRVRSGEIKLTVYSADQIQFDGQSCILAVSEDIHDRMSELHVIVESHRPYLHMKPFYPHIGMVGRPGRLLWLSAICSP